MSGWMSWWGGGAAQKQKQSKQTKDTIVSMTAHTDMLKKKADHLQKQIDTMEGEMKVLLVKDRKGALAVGRRKKTKEHELDQTQNMILAMEKQAMALSSASMNAENYRQTQQINETLKTINKGMTVDKVDDMMESIREHTAMNEEIAQAMAAPANTIDEDEELEEELERMRQEQLDEEMLKTGSVPVDRVSNLPAAANGELKNKPAPLESEEEAELRKLQAEMAM
ncbi:vacuolar-sorting protein snf7 [Plectosphaerella cucumerina]|uniref:Vacuolar-sorting protein SNF7 n=1 Tax=Plectosphaerella cucumerina TaxID=40658 RepID=A0A8K0TC75_9PEZI|nr:vacuolar-sorting protein snf7 [Plectosphaerella cucumerina]